MIKIFHQLTTQNTLKELSEQESTIGKQIFQTNLQIKPNETVIIITDQELLEKEAAIWFETAKMLAQDVKMIIIDGMTHSGEEPPEGVVKAVAQADIAILHTTFSLTHTRAGKAVKTSQHRGFSLPGVDYDMMVRTLTQNYQPIASLGRKIQDVLSKGEKIHITNSAGTDLTADIRTNLVINDSGFVKKGEIGNLPAGEVFFAPLLNSTNGTWVVNGSMADEDDLDEPITIKIINGRASSITGGRAAERLQEKLKSVGQQAFNVAEIGIGTNPETNPHGDLIEAEKAYATAHLALGNSSAIGGEIDVPIHLDGLTLEPKIEADGTVICEGGEFLI